MAQIAHYEVYVDSGSGWQLVDRFAIEQRAEAYQRAKEEEHNKNKVKIIKESFEITDNTYTDSVEYISTQNKKGTKKTLSKIDYQKASNEVVQDIADSRRNIYKAVLKFIALIIISLIFANIFVSLIFPLLEIFLSEDNSSSMLFFIFFIVFIAMAVPLVLKNIPWYIFISQESNEKKDVTEDKFFEKANNLVRAYNINSNLGDLKLGSFPEAPLEYKQYLIYFLSEILSNLNVRSALQDKFSRFGVKLLVFGGCLELSRYGGLKMSEANSVLYDALKITDGPDADLEEFYEAKASYSDNKVAIYLTGIGAYLMNQVLTDQSLYTKVLNTAFDKWEAQRNPGVKTSIPQKEKTSDNSDSSKETSPVEEVQATQDEALVEIQPQISITSCLVNIKSDLKFLDNSIKDQDKIAAATSETISNFVRNLSAKYQGYNINEQDGLTTVTFYDVNNGIKFAGEFMKDIASYNDENYQEGVIYRNCCAITIPSNMNDEDYDKYIKDVFEHIYNSEIIIVEELEEKAKENDCELEFLGSKLLKESQISANLYKLKY